MTATLDRAAWLEERRMGVGASDVPAICCVEGAYGSPWSVWADKCGLAPLEADPSPSMQLGRDLEPVIAAWFHRETGLTIAGEQTLVRHRREPRWFATVDGFVLESDADGIDDALGVVECKFTAEQPWEKLPERVEWQVQWQLGCSDLGAAWVAALHLPFGRPDFRVYEVTRDDGLIAHAQALVADFWEHHVATGIPPFVDDSPATAAAIDAAWGALSTERVPTVELDEERDLVAEWVELKSRSKALERAVDHAATRIKERFGLAGTINGASPSEGTIGGRLAVSWRHQSRDGGVDVERVRADHGAAYDKPRSEYRVLRAHGRT